MPSTSVPETLDFRPSIRQTMVITRKSLETDGQISRVEIDLEGGQGDPPAQLHPGQREIYTVDAGELVVTVDGESHVINAGESIEVPTGSAHTFANQSDKLVRFSAEHLPALQIEEYMRLVHRTVEGRKPSSVASSWSPYTGCSWVDGPPPDREGCVCRFCGGR